MASNNTISWSATYEILTYFRRELGQSDLHRKFMSARLDDLCPYFCLNPMTVHRKTYFSMFLQYLSDRENNIWHVKFWRFTQELVVFP